MNSAGATRRASSSESGRLVDAEKFGGEVPARDKTQWTRTALVRDPQGAEFTLSQFTPPS